jgi:hypothetical protein
VRVRVALCHKPTSGRGTCAGTFPPTAIVAATATTAAGQSTPVASPTIVLLAVTVAAAPSDINSGQADTESSLDIG